MNARLLLALAGFLGGFLLWLLFSGPEGPFSAHARTPDAGRTPSPENAARLEVPLAAPDAVSAIAVPRPPDPSSARREAREPREKEHRPVVVRVQLALASGVPGSFQDWTVEAQSWIEATNETFPHETRANAAGAAEFTFDGFVHIDWVRCVPPPASGLALAFAEHHEDLEPGDLLEDTLELEPGGLVSGRVVDEQGMPVSGAGVHAYADGPWDDPSLWQPGLATAVSASDGRFTLPPLPPGSWGLAVEPRGWLQLDPELGSEEDGRNSFELAAWDRIEGGDLCVVRLHSLRVRVLDAANRPAPEAKLELQPLELRVAGLRIEGEEPDELEVFLGRAPQIRLEGRPWPYDALAWTTDAAGEATLYGVEGTWALEVQARLEDQELATGSVRVVLDLPGPDRTVRLSSTLEELAGQVVVEEGRALEGVAARLRRGRQALSETTSAEGRFTFRGVAPGGDFRLELTHAQYLPAQWSVRTGVALAPRRFELRRASSVRLRFQDHQGAPVRFAPVSVLATLPEEPPTAAERAWNEQRPVRASGSTDAAGRWQFAQLPRGRVEIGLSLPFATGTVDGYGTPHVEQRILQRWIVPVQDGEQCLEVDLGAYVAPTRPPLPRHVGLVFDALSGAPLADAYVLVRSKSAARQVATDSEGRFAVDGPPGRCTLLVSRAGYLRQELLEQNWGAGLHEHRFALRPGGHELALTFLDREGAPLSYAQVLARDDAGEPFLLMASTGNVQSYWNGQQLGHDGSLVLFHVPPGRLHFDLEIEGHPLGNSTVEVLDGLAREEATVRLEHTLAELRAGIERSLAGEDD